MTTSRSLICLLENQNGGKLQKRRLQYSCKEFVTSKKDLFSFFVVNLDPFTTVSPINREFYLAKGTEKFILGRYLLSDLGGLSLARHIGE
jgi:hypothetical protein